MEEINYFAQTSEMRLWINQQRQKFLDERTGILNGYEFGKAAIEAFGLSDEKQREAVFALMLTLEEKSYPTLRQLRLRLGYSNHREFAKVVGLASSTIWLAEVNRPIARETAKYILVFLCTHHQICLSEEQIQWTLSHATPRGSTYTKRIERKIPSFLLEKQEQSES